MKGALKPIGDVRDIWLQKDEEMERKTGIDPEDAKLAALATTQGWKVLKEHIQSLSEGLDTRLSESVLGGLTDEQIRKDALFAVLGKELLKSIINKVEDSREHVDERTEGKK